MQLDSQHDLLSALQARGEAQAQLFEAARMARTTLEHQRKYWIYGKDRFVVTTNHVRAIVAEAGLRVKRHVAESEAL